MKSIDRQILRNQAIIMETLNALLHAPGVYASDLHKKLNIEIKRTGSVLDQDNLK